MTTFDPDLLRSFLAFVDSGILARAAVIVGRTPSAVTAQMRRLEAQAGEPLLVAEGRGLRLTPAGQTLARHARRILAPPNLILTHINRAIENGCKDILSSAQLCRRRD